LVNADSTVIAQVESDADGSFSVPCYAPEPFKVAIDIGAARRWYRGRTFADAALIDVAAGATSDPIDVVESGLLLDLSEPTGQREWRARVELVDPDTREVAGTYLVTVADGYPFHGISNLDTGTYLLHLIPDPFLAQNWLEEWYDGAGGPEGARPVTVPPGGGVAKVQVALRAGGGISGSIWYEPREDAFGAVLYLTRSDDPTAIGNRHPGYSWCCQSITWQEPMEYTLGGLAPGSYKIGIAPAFDGGVWLGWAQQPPDGTVWYPNTTHWGDAETLMIDGAGVINGVDFDLR
jgi:hypothetical protein